jgi:microcystin-dependent protein
MSQPFLGQLSLFGFGLTPKNWAVCNGALLQISTNQALFSLLGTTYGGNGQTTFGLPDLRGRAALGSSGQYPLGAVAGEEGHTLTSGEIPVHNHVLQGVNLAGDQTRPPANLLANTPAAATIYQSAPTANNFMSAGTIAPAGGSQPHENRTPFLALNWCIALAGIFPSRN